MWRYISYIHNDHTSIPLETKQVICIYIYHNYIYNPLPCIGSSLVRLDPKVPRLLRCMMWWRVWTMQVGSCTSGTESADSWHFGILNLRMSIILCLVVWNMNYIYFSIYSIGNFIIPTDFKSIIFQRGRAKNHQPDRFSEDSERLRSPHFCRFNHSRGCTSQAWSHFRQAGMVLESQGIGGKRLGPSRDFFRLKTV